MCQGRSLYFGNLAGRANTTAIDRLNMSVRSLTSPTLWDLTIRGSNELYDTREPSSDIVPILNIEHHVLQWQGELVVDMGVAITRGNRVRFVSKAEVGAWMMFNVDRRGIDI